MTRITETETRIVAVLRTTHLNNLLILVNTKAGKVWNLDSVTLEPKELSKIINLVAGGQI